MRAFDVRRSCFLVVIGLELVPLQMRMGVKSIILVERLGKRS